VWELGLFMNSNAWRTNTPILNPNWWVD
jgi:hypothetical protein